MQALKQGNWVLLDELNLATQSVLEGLNSCLDHRAQVYIPELGKTINCPHTFRIFAAQNPLGQGGGRKGLPKSFLNRFKCSCKCFSDDIAAAHAGSVFLFVSAWLSLTLVSFCYVFAFLARSMPS